MNRDDAEQLALAYCLRNLRDTPGGTRARAERDVMDEARARYGSGLTRAATSRIRKQLRDRRPPRGLQSMLRLDQ